MERRNFLKVLGVSSAGATMGCGSSEADRLIPYLIPHEDVVPGLATWYRTTCRECPAGCGMSIRTREGRAVKAEGNPLSPISQGALCARGQASLHGLYDPDRIRQALAREGDGWAALVWDDAEQRLADALAQNRGNAVFLSESFGPTLDRLVDDFCAAFDIQRVRWSPFALEPLRAANRMLFGVDALPVHEFAQAEVVLTFGADFLETWVSPVGYAHGFTTGRAYDAGRRGRMIAVSPHQSLTDMNADEWLSVRPGTEHRVALALARLIADAGADAGGAAPLLQTVDVAQVAVAAGISEERLRRIAGEFANGGRSLAVGGGIATQHTHATALAAAVAVLNSVAGNIGTTVRFEQTEQSAPVGSYADMRALLDRMRAGQVGALLVHGPNPLYALPTGDGVEEALGQVGFVASFSPFLDETSARSNLLLPDHHFLESWGDCEPRSGVLSLVQPVMTPVFQTKQTADVLLSVATRAGATLPGATTTFYDYLRARWGAEVLNVDAVEGGFEVAWREALTVGFVAEPASAGGGAQTQAGAGQAQAARPIDAAGLGQIDFSEPTFSGDGEHVLVVYPSAKYYDGRMANRPWLQELPDPISKYAWSSWVEVNPETAAELGLDDGHLLEVATPFGSTALPVFRHPGTRPDVVAIQLGQGHTGFGTYAQDRGVNAVHLLDGVVDPASGALAYIQTHATLTPTGEWGRPIQAGLGGEQHERHIAEVIALDEARAADAARGLPLVALAPAGAGEAGQEEEGEHAEQHPLDAHVGQLQASGGFEPAELDASPSGYPMVGTHYGEYTEAQPRWGMTIDLDRCTGCSACITACYAENNIGIVGPEQVQMGRILHWIRLERYFEGEGESLHTRFLPMLCQQCGNAPCEPVCPVYAAYHTPDGLNAQVYNRCVGTRYCANNCPYKVRYFNYFSWEWPEPLNWQLNPDVTVREKGVMEKCTFCVQRIRDAENHARLEDRGVRDGEIQPACAQTCPAQAIVFGNFRDEGSRVARSAESGRAYRVLDHLNTQSAIVYLKQVAPEGAQG